MRTSRTAAALAAALTLAAGSAHALLGYYHVVFEGNGGTPERKEIDYRADEPYGSFPTVERPGYDFMGWMYNLGMYDMLKTTDIVPDKAAMSVHACWSNPLFNAALNCTDGMYSYWTFMKVPSLHESNFAVVTGSTAHDGQGALRLKGNATIMDFAEISIYVPQGTHDAITFWYKTTSKSGGLTWMTSAGQYQIVSTGSTSWKQAVIPIPAGGASLTLAGIDTLIDQMRATMLNAVPTTPPEKPIIVTFNATGGTALPASKAVTPGEPYGTLPEPTRPGYTFDGWHTGYTSDGYGFNGSGEQITETTIVTQTKNHIVYAKWEGEKYMVTFDGNDGAPETQSQIQTYGERYILPPQPSHPNGFLFIGWYKDRFAATMAVTPATRVTFVGEHTLYAGWAAPGIETAVFALADGPGTVTMNPASGKVINGKPVTLTAKPGKDAVFVDWTGGGQVSCAAAIQVAPTNDTVYTARFRMKGELAAPAVESVEPSPNQMAGLPFTARVEVNDAAKPVKFKAAKLPAGLKIDAATGVISGIPTKVGTSEVVVSVTSVANSKSTASVTMTIAIAALPENAQGTFNGWAMDGTNVCGSLTATVSAVGKLTAKVISAGGTWSFAAPSWSDRQGGVFIVNAATKGGQTLTLELDSALPWNECQVSGELNGQSGVAAQRNPFTNAKDATRAAALAALAPYSKTYYTLALDGTAVPGSLGGAGNLPEGHGYLTATVSDKGAVKIAGKLADGTGVSGSATLLMGDGTASVPYFVPLYGKQGFAAGILGISAAGQLTGYGDWAYPGKTPAGKAPATEDRFAVTLLADGARYDTGAKLADYCAGLVFASGEIGVELLADAKGGVFIPKGKAAKLNKESGEYEYDEDNPNLVTFTAKAATGLFSGKFSLYEMADGKLKTASVSHQGVLVQKPGAPFGKGHCLMTETWDSGDAKPVKYTVKRSHPVTVE